MRSLALIAVSFVGLPLIDSHYALAGGYASAQAGIGYATPQAALAPSYGTCGAAAGLGAGCGYGVAQQALVPQQQVVVQAAPVYVPQQQVVAIQRQVIAQPVYVQRQVVQQAIVSPYVVQNQALADVGYGAQAQALANVGVANGVASRGLFRGRAANPQPTKSKAVVKTGRGLLRRR